MYLKGRARRGPTFRECVLMHAVSRLVFAGHIDNIQASWVKMGHDGVVRCLQAGANDLGGTLMNETITRSAGANHGQETGPEQMEALIYLAGRAPRMRNTLYEEVTGERRAAAFAAPELIAVSNTVPARRRGSGGGAGLGLALVAEHVRLHDGRVWVEDRADDLDGIPVGCVHLFHGLGSATAVGTLEVAELDDFDLGVVGAQGGGVVGDLHVVALRHHPQATLLAAGNIGDLGGAGSRLDCLRRRFCTRIPCVVDGGNRIPTVQCFGRHLFHSPGFGAGIQAPRHTEGKHKNNRARADDRR